MPAPRKDAKGATTPHSAPKKPRVVQQSQVAIKGRPEWGDWLKSFAEFSGMPYTILIDIALKEKAERDKFPQRMPKRQAR